MATTTLSDLKTRAHNTKSRQSNIFLRVEVGGSYEFKNIGRVKNASVSSDAVQSEADQDGRTSTHRHDITASFVMQQAAMTELSLIPDLERPDPTDYPNGHTLYFSGKNTLTESDINNNLTTGPTVEPDLPDYTILGDTSATPYDPQGFLIANVLLSATPDLDLTADSPGMINIEFNGRIDTEQLSTFADNSVKDGNHILVSPF